jgi:hypothetical protein
MRRLLGFVTLIAIPACGGPRGPLPAVVPERAGCFVLGPEATAAPFHFPDTLELAAEWFLPEDSTGGRLRVVRPRDAAIETFRTYGGRFWWETAGDSIVVTRSDGVTGVVLALPAAAPEFTGVIRTVGSGVRSMERVSGQRIACPEPLNPSTAQPPQAPEGRS